MFGDSLDARFRARLRPEPWRWLAGKAPAGARPVHAFHVFDVFPRVGLMRGGEVTDVLATIDNCRIRWGTVVERLGDRLLVDAIPLAMVDGRLVLAPPRREAIRGWHDGHGFVDDAGPGDTVAIHWDWACERLDTARLAALRDWTNRQLAIANQTI